MRLKILTGRRVLVTAGPTREPIDPVRYISNRSSGKMGYAIAAAARAAGARVTLVSGPVDLKAPRGIPVIRVETSAQMRRAVCKEWGRSDILFMVAAVSDFVPAVRHRKKIKKSARPMVMRFKPAPDILAAIGCKKKPGQTVVGFAAETDRHLAHARRKLRMKNVDALFLNPVEVKDSGFAAEQNEGWLLCKDGKSLRFPRQSKKSLARSLIRALFPVS